jgi:hypothetical protein
MKQVLDDRYKLITESKNENEEIKTNKADSVDNYRSDLMQFMLYNERSELTETTSLKGLLSEKANWEHIYTKEDVEIK